MNEIRFIHCLTQHNIFTFQDLHVQLFCHKHIFQYECNIPTQILLNKFFSEEKYNC